TEALWRQFGAAIDMLEDAIEECPDDLWRHRLWRDGQSEVEYSEVWNVISHALFWLDLYLSGTEEGFAPPAPFGLEELDASGPLPPRVFTKDELLTYLRDCRNRCRATVEQMSDGKAQALHEFGWGKVDFFELQMYNMRHVQEHAAQLALLLGHERGIGTRWVGQVR
ncbi:MAG: DinB family protein, partial [Vicinamibacterales bacterium]